MKKFFLDQFYIQTICAEKTGKTRLKCLGTHDGGSFIFNLYLDNTELEHLLKGLNETGKRIRKWLTRAISADLLQLFRYAVAVDSCWLTIQVVEFNEPLEEDDKEYYVENFGFIPDELWKESEKTVLI